MKILIVEDDKLLGNSLKQGLEELGNIVDLAQDGAEGLFLAEKSSYQILLVDWMLPRLSGIELIQTLRERGIHTPAIVLTARGSLEDKVEGLTLADDYQVKPFEMAELVARIKALHRRTLPQNSPILLCGRLAIHSAQSLAMVDNTPLNLTPKEFDLLEILASRPDNTITKADLNGLLYTYEDEPESNSIDVLIARLRKKLEGSGAEIITIRGRGYLFRVEKAKR